MESVIDLMAFNYMLYIMLGAIIVMPLTIGLIIYCYRR